MMSLAPAFIHVAAVVVHVLMKVLKSRKPDGGKQGETIKEPMPWPNHVSG